MQAQLKSIFGKPYKINSQVNNINGFYGQFDKLFENNNNLAVRSGVIKNVEEYNHYYDPNLEGISGKGDEKKYYLPQHVLAKKTVLGRIILFDFQFQTDTKHRLVLVTGWHGKGEYALILFNLENFKPTTIRVEEENGAKVLYGLPETTQFLENAPAMKPEPAVAASAPRNAAQQATNYYNTLTDAEKAIFKNLGLNEKWFQKGVTVHEDDLGKQDIYVRDLILMTDYDVVRVINARNGITTDGENWGKKTLNQLTTYKTNEDQTLTDWELRNYDSARLNDISSIPDLQRYATIFPWYYDFMKYHVGKKNYIIDKASVHRAGIEPKNYLPGRWKNGTKGITKSGWFGNLFSSKGSTVKEDGAKATAKATAATAASAPTFSTEGATQVSRATERGLWNMIKGDLPTDAMYSHAGFLCTVLTHLSKVDAGHIKIWDDALQELVMAPKKVRPDISPECGTHVRDDMKNYKILAKQYTEIMDVINEIREAKPGADKADDAKIKKRRNAKLAELRDKVCTFEDPSKEIARIVREIKSNTTPIINTAKALNSKTEAKRAERAKIIYDAAYKKINESIIARANAIKVRLDAKDMKALAAKVDEIVKSRSSNSTIDAKEYARVTKELEDIDKKSR